MLPMKRSKKKTQAVPIKKGLDKDASKTNSPPVSDGQSATRECEFYLLFNRIELAAAAWRGYKDSGRGFVLVCCDHACDLEDAKFAYCAESKISRIPDPSLAAALAKAVSEYDANIHVVVLFQIASTTLELYDRYCPNPRPPQAGAPIFKSIAEILHLPRMMGSCEELEICLGKVMKEPEMHLSVEGLRSLAVGSAFVDMRELHGRAQRKSRRSEKKDGSGVHTLQALIHPHCMDGEQDMWNFFNQHLRPLDEPQPEPREGKESDNIQKAATALWAFEQSRRLTKATNSGNVALHYFHAYEIIRLISEQGRQGNETAVEALASIANFAANLLEKMPKDILRAVARRHPSWPAMVSARAADRSKQSAYLKELGLGTECPLNVAPKARWSVSVPATKHAVKLLATLEYNRALAPMNRATLEGAVDAYVPKWAARATALPPFTKASVSQWWDVALVVLKEAYRKVETHPDFNLPGAAVAPKIVNFADRRAEIVERVRAAFVALAPADRTPS